MEELMIIIYNNTIDMKNFKTLLLDDEKHCNKTIKHHLSNTYLSNSEIVDFNDPMEAVSYMQSHPIDLLFLDIDMPILNGFDVLEELSEVEFDLIIVTAYDHFALQAIKASAIDYLLKPILFDDLEIAIDKFKNISLQKEKKHSQFFRDNINEIKQNKLEKLIIPTKSGFLVEPFQNICAFEADGEYTHIFIEGGEKIMVCKNLGHFEKILPPDTFIRIHRKHIVNATKIHYLGKEEGGMVRMLNEMTFAVSRSKYDLIKAYFNY